MRHATVPEMTERRRKAVEAARARGEAAAKWFAEGNKLTPETKPEFDKLMKSVNQQSNG